MTQEEFEEILKPSLQFTAIYFGATWCGPCKRVDLQALESMTGVNWLKCDIDQNTYTPGYCSVRSIPSFLVVADGKAIGPLQESDTTKVMEWVLNQQEAWIKTLDSK